MAQIRPKISLRYGRQNQPVRITTADLVVDPLAYTYLTSDTSSSTSTIGVQNSNGFGTGQLIGIGTFGNEGSEILNTHATTAVTQTTVTLGVSTKYPHSAGTPINRIPYDQVTIYTAPTLTGALTTLTTIGIKGDYSEVIYNDTATTSGYYFARFSNSVNSSFSALSDASPVSGYTRATARSVIDRALNVINKKQSEVLSDEYAFQCLDDFQMEVTRELKRWSWLQTFDYNISGATEGGWSVALPTDVDDQNTTKSIYQFRIGTDPNMNWVDKEKWNQITSDVAHSTLATTILVGATTATLADSGDFDDAGTIHVGAESYDYDTNSRTANLLGLSSTASTQSVIGLDAFQGESKGTPRYWTTYGGYIYHYPVTDSEHAGRNYYLDYYKALTPITTDSDTLLVPDPVAAEYYLGWRFLLKLNNGEENTGSQGMLSNYVLRREKLKQKEVLGTTFVLRPRFNDWSRQMNNFEDDDKRTRLGNFENI